MNNIEKRIERAINISTPDVLDKILLDCETQEGDIKMTTVNNITPIERHQAKGGYKFLRAKWVSVAAAMLILGFGTYFGYNRFAVAATIAFDVNPSIELKVNQAETVLSAEALNADAEIILKNMKLKGVDLEVAVNAVIGAMLKNGYVDEIKNSILISVENKNAEKGAALQSKLTNEVSSLLDALSVKGAVLSLNVSDDERLTTLAEKHGLTLGKTALIDLLVSQDTRLKFEDIAPLSINDINLLIASKNMTSETLESTGNASTNAYIGEDEAHLIAVTHAKTKSGDVKFAKSKLDWDDGHMVYDIEFSVANTKYDYEIDALSGAVLEYDTVTKKLPEPSPSKPIGDNFIGEDKAKTIALEHVGLDAKAVEFYRVKLDKDDGRNVYDVEFYSGNIEYDYEIDAVSGSILEYDADIENYSHPKPTNPSSKPEPSTQYPSIGPSLPPSPPVSDNYIGNDRAKNIALAHAELQESAVTKLEVSLDRDDGKVTYEVDFKKGKTEYEYEIDAVSGKILKWDTDFED